MTLLYVMSILLKYRKVNDTIFLYQEVLYGIFIWYEKKEKKDTARDDYSQEDLSKRVEEIKREQEREIEETKRRAMETDAMISDSIKKMNAIANGPNAQSIRSSDLDYLDKILGRTQSSSTEQELIARHRGEISESEKIEKKEAIKHESETEELPVKDQPKYVADFSDDRLLLMTHSVSIVDSSPDFINQLYGILKEFGHYGYGTDCYPSFETSLDLANSLKSLRDSGANIDAVLLSQAEKNKRAKDVRNRQDPDYANELGQMLDDKATGKVESRDAKRL